MPSFGVNSEPACPSCGADCTIGFAHARFGTWSLRALKCQNKASCGEVYRSIWVSTRLHHMSRFYGSISLVNNNSRVKELDFSGLSVCMLTPFVEIPVELKEETSANFIQPKFFERTWVANYQKHDDMVQVKITLEACESRYKRPYAYQNAVIVIGNSKIVLPLSGAWFGETDNVSEYQNAILCFVDSVLRTSTEDTNAALGVNFSWENFCTYKKPLKRLVAPFLINQEYPELWSDVDVCCDKFQEIGERLIGTFDIFEIDELLCQSRVLSGIRKPIPRERSPRNCLHLLMD